MNYATVKKYDVANGPGVRVSLFVSGCTHRCKNCFNSEAWDFDYGQPFGEDTEEEIFAALEKSYIKGFSLLGGEPFEPRNQQVLAPFLEKLRRKFPDKTVWCYTGYTLDKDLLNTGKTRTEYTDRMLSCIDILVDGEFIEEEKDLTIRFRGSRNQRIINLRQTLESGSVRVLADDEIEV